ncbi:hypothetical protein HMPREF1624_01154 [Sporothrix schenckii ATCC 58251]|uniref:Major facilitator superfamily (MFS) profile domain-containing protein n=1 Tax=Sporothrix schenckii (strain ATCC 58251 / de Perez 2211183) TaxID=1391915 RepID=U7Q7X2_SPOS1|nr:hypothetical protein HMPREF1624_01154 [Sporothrix schenckii ATCC 58251]
METSDIAEGRLLNNASAITLVDEAGDVAIVVANGDAVDAVDADELEVPDVPETPEEPDMDGMADDDLDAFTPTTEVEVMFFPVGSAVTLKDDGEDAATKRDKAHEKTAFVDAEAALASVPTSEAALPWIAPDGGAIAWSQVVAGFLLNTIAWGTSMMFGVYQLHYTQTLGLDSGAVSWIGSVQTFLTYFVSTVSGLLADAGYSRHVTAAGTLLVVAGGLGTSFAAPVVPSTSTTTGGPVPPALFLCQAIIMGVGLGLLSAPALPSISAYFSKRRSLALAVTTTGTSAGGALLPVVVQFLLPAVGFGWAVRCATLLTLVVCTSAGLLLRPVPPAALSKPALGVPASDVDAGSGRTRTARLAAVAAQIVDWSAFRELPFVLFMANSFLLFWGLYFGYYYINTYAKDVVGFSTDQATLLLVLSTALGIPGRLASGALADAVTGALDTYIITTVMLAATVFAWLAVGTSTAGLYVFVVVFGLCNGAAQSVWLGSIAELSSHASSRIGARFGTVCVVAAVATLAGAPTASALIGMANGGANNLTLASTYRIAQVWGAATTLASAGVLVATRIYTIGWRLRR